MKILGIIQARMNSTRLPGKVMLEISGKPLLDHIITRCSISNIHEIVVATTTNTSDDIIEIYCNSKNILIYRGEEENVLKRFYDCAKKTTCDIIVRITSDDPFKDPDIINIAIKKLVENDFDYVSNTIQPTYPEGIDIEVFTFNALEKAFQNATLDSEKEHVTPYIWKNTKLFKTYNFKCKEDLSKLRWTIDNNKDIEFAREIYKELYLKKPIFLLNDILKLINEKPNLKDINSGTIRNEGYHKSLKNEKNIR